MWGLIKQKLKNWGHWSFAMYGRLRYGWWYRKLTIVAVTGTDGRSSTVLLSAHLLRSLGFTVAHYSSISYHDGLMELPNNTKMTTPGKARLHRFLAQAYYNGATHAVVEITSEGILQHRHRGIQFDVVAFTNITPEHIERHGSFEAYLDAKLSLMKARKRKGVVVCNVADATLQAVYSRFVQDVAVPVAVPLTGVEGADIFRTRNDFFARAIIEDGLGIPVGEATTALCNIPGRFEIFRGSTTVIVDYAHTLAAVELSLKQARQLTNGRVIHVFGAAGGGRDRYKRPLLAKLSEKYSDVHIITEENSFDEPVEQIMNEIGSGFSQFTTVYRFSKREDAVKYALSLARPEDMVLCTAKGSEMVIAGPKRMMRPYNEREFVKTCLAQK